MTVTVSMPSIAFGLPKVRRIAPDCRSAPTKPSVKPTASEINPRTIEEPKSVPTVANARTMSAK